MASPLLGPILIAGAGTFITWFFQRQSDIIQQAQSNRDAELKRANDSFAELSDLMDSFAYYNREVVYALVLRPGTEASRKKAWTDADEESWKKYVKVQEEWNMAHSRHLAETKKIFGPTARERLENIQNDFTIMQAHVQATYFDREVSEFYLLNTTGGNPDSKMERDRYPLYDAYLKNWDVVSEKIESLNELMLDKIQTERVGML